MPKKTITIKGIVSDTNKLDLSDGGWTKVKIHWKYRNVTWKIDKKCLGVKSFLIKGKTRHNPFEQKHIPRDFGSMLPLIVGQFQTPLEWKYSIHWKGEDNITHVFDPKISILP